MEYLDKTTVLTRLASMEKHYSTAHSVMRDADRLFNQEYEGLIDVPYEVRIFRSSTPSRIVESFRNQIRTNEPTVDYRPVSSSKTDDKDATLMKRWGYSMLRKERLLSTMDPNLQCGFDLLLRGAACKKIVVDVDRMVESSPRRGTEKYREWENRATDSWPYISMAIDPMSVFPAPGQRKPLQFMLEKQTRYASDMWDMYPEWKDPQRNTKRGSDPTRRVDWVEYWDPCMYIVLADGEYVMEPRENPYGVVPYIFEWSGMGRAHSNGDPAHLAVGILTYIAGELEEEVQLKTAISVQTQMHVFPPILTVEDPRKVAQQFGVGPGKVIRHPPGHPPEYMQYPPPNENFYRFLDAIQSNISRVLAPALSGGRDSGTRYGVLQAQQIGQSLKTISPALATLDNMGTQTLNMMSTMAKTMDLDMAVEGTQEPVEATQRILGKDHKHQNFEVTFEAIDPAENDRALLVGEALRRAGDISRRTFWRVYAKHIVTDPDVEDTNLLEEKVMEMLAQSGMLMEAALSPEVQNQLSGQGLQGVQDAIGGIVQNRTDDTIPQDAANNAQELETISGRPGNSNIPREVAQEGMRNARPSQTGLPGR
jgi:hypothetical protein